MAAPQKVDYARIEPDWRLGFKSPRQLASEYEANTGNKVSHQSIIKHFTKLGIPRDLTAKAVAKAQSMVDIAMVDSKGDTSTAVATINRETTPRDAEIIEYKALDHANTLLSHRKDITIYRNLAAKLLAEIEIETDHPESFEELAKLVIWDQASVDGVQTKAEVDRMVRLQMLFDRVMSNPGRVDSLKKLADTMKTLIGLERQALGLKDDDVPPDYRPPITKVVFEVVHKR